MQSAENTRSRARIGTVQRALLLAAGIILFVVGLYFASTPSRQPVMRSYDPPTQSTADQEMMATATRALLKKRCLATPPPRDYVSQEDREMERKCKELLRDDK